MKRFIAKLFRIYTFENFQRDIYQIPLSLTQLSVLYDLQRKAQFDYDNNILIMTTEFLGYYRNLLKPFEEKIGNNTYQMNFDIPKGKGFEYLMYKGYRLVEIPNKIG